MDVCATTTVQAGIAEPIVVAAGEKRRRVDSPAGEVEEVPVVNRRGGSPYPRSRPAERADGKLPGPKLPTGRELAQRLAEAKSRLQIQRSRKSKTDTVPIRAYENYLGQRLDIGELLRSTPFPQLTWGQLLDRSPSIRAQLTREMGLTTKGRKPVRLSHMISPFL